eukprot:m.47067 g.47067  ORF g.47067 m.47067 type:complete len:144 (-) comp47509_c0_seq1:169-600(-)
MPKHQSDSSSGPAAAPYDAETTTTTASGAAKSTHQKRVESKHATESDEHRLQQRMKQIEFGKNTLGYTLYLQSVPKKDRKKGEHPVTPDVKRKCSKRAWDGLVRNWRKALHVYDPKAEDTVEAEQVDLTDLGVLDPELEISFD